MKILTFDIEDWFNLLEHPSTDDIDNWKKFESRVEKSTLKILDLLDETNTKATFFVLGWVAENQPAIVKEMVNRGHHIGTHSYAHKVAYSQNISEFEEDLKKSISLLEDAAGIKITSYRAPGFSITPNNMWAYEVLAKHDIFIDSSIFPAARYHGGFKDFPTTEPFIFNIGEKEIFSFPLNTKKILNIDLVYSGGGYFRLLPKKIISKFIKNDDYVMTYFHPRDFDHDQPMMENLSLFRKFKSYYGIKGAYEKLRTILKENNFVSIESAYHDIDWQNKLNLNLDKFT